MILNKSSFVCHKQAGGSWEKAFWDLVSTLLYGAAWEPQIRKPQRLTWMGF